MYLLLKFTKSIKLGNQLPILRSSFLTSNLTSNSIRKFTTHPSSPTPIPSESSTKVENKNAFSWKSFAALVFVGGSALLYFKYEIEKSKSRAVRTSAVSSSGKPVVGGSFCLLNSKDGKLITDKHFRGRYMLMYFGFTNCPEICPLEMEKMTKAMNILDSAIGPLVQPIFITVDPKRDTLDVLETYRKRYHKRLLTLTGDPEAVAKASKAFRIYISSIPEGETDYLVDHSICFYLMDTNGEILEYFGQNYESNEMCSKMIDIIKKDQNELLSGKKQQKL